MNRAQEVLLHILEYQRLCSKGAASQPLKEAAAKLAPPPHAKQALTRNRFGTKFFRLLTRAT
jgi:hypothetical protein